MPDILLIGAGLTNLALALEFEKNGFFDYQIVEVDSRPGGLLKTCKKGPFLFDHTGHFLHVSNPDFKSFLAETMGIENFNILGRQSFIFLMNQYLPYPIQKNLYGLPADTINYCLESFLARPKISNPKTFYSWVLTHFGKGLLDIFFAPYNKKLFCRSTKSVSASWTGRFVPNTTIEELRQGADKRPIVDPSGYNGSFFYPKDGGIELLVKAILRKLKNPITCQNRLIGVDLASKKAFFSTGQPSIVYKALVSTIALPNLLKMLPKGGAVDWVGASLKLLSSAVLCLNLGLDRVVGEGRHWVYFPEPRFSFYRTGFWHNFNSINCPPGTSGIYAEVATLKKGPEGRDEIVERSKQELFDMLAVDKSSVIAEHVQFLDNAYVIFNRFREQNLGSMLNSLAQDNIHSIGRFGAWKYSSMQEAFLEGQAMARSLMVDLKFKKVLSERNV